jgi:hypothetical protein
MNAGSFETLSESPSKGDGPATNSKSDEGGKRLKPQRVKKKVRCPLYFFVQQHTIPSHVMPPFRYPQSLETKTAKKPVCMHGNCMACSFLMMCATGDLH